MQIHVPERAYCLQRTSIVMVNRVGAAYSQFHAGPVPLADTLIAKNNSLTTIGI